MPKEDLGIGNTSYTVGAAWTLGSVHLVMQPNRRLDREHIIRRPARKAGITRCTEKRCMQTEQIEDGDKRGDQKG